ncbi:uncharacterized protein LOC121571419 [Coregonus clupeaformis]|uniref:uncharacterized protein LOC121571419 n=1 Tax=Coregonus clupeaformis TaxID=59861 RepID=UPI001BE0EA95|nr:uncharacterized protein LOC121571419 [Coregonus clupeaformis]
MHLLSMSTKWPSYDSRSSTPSFLLSESDVTEDEADIDVFTSESEEDSSGGGKTCSVPFSLAGGGEAAPRLHWSMARSGQAECFPHTTIYPSMVASPGSAALSTKESTEETMQGDLAFAQKCSELQKFIKPLLELLNGLKTGRFERGLSNFQSSIAIDRLQRILGILQKPDMGEKFLRTLLQVEMMLKMWFPHVTPVAATQNPTPSLPPRWHQNQLCMPVKKRKLSWLDSDFPSAAPPSCKCMQYEDNYQEVTSRDSSPLSTDTYNPSCLTVSRKRKGNKRLDISPCSACGSQATQDSRVSSTLLVFHSHQLSLHGHQPRRCHSGPGTVKTQTDITSVGIQRRSQSIPTLLRSMKQELEWSTGT